jgi:hypothetical protein
MMWEIVIDDSRNLICRQVTIERRRWDRQGNSTMTEGTSVS